MKENFHFYSKYGQAIIELEKESIGLDDKSAIKYLLEKSISCFRLKPNFIASEKDVNYSYSDVKVGNSKNGIYLSPHIISTDKLSQQLWSKLQELKNNLDKNPLSKLDKVLQSLAPVSGEYNNGKLSKQNPKASFFEVLCCAITTTTTDKPSMFSKSRNGNYENKCIIPDIELPDLKDFIDLYRTIINKNTKNLFKGVVSIKEESSVVKFYRPAIHNGNFPNAPKSGYLAPVGMLAAIGEWGKEAKYTDWANKVLDSLSGAPLYLVSYSNTESFSYSHHIVELAKKGDLKAIVDSIYYIEILGKGARNFSAKDNNNEYEKLDLFASRFLQLFNRPALKDFLAIRAEYPVHLNKLFTTYFMKMEHIPKEVVTSARFLGRWLNYVAYLAAKNENTNVVSEEFKKAKAKVLVEMESSAFAAKNGDALIAQVITRAGRLSQMDAPPEVTLFIEQTCSGELPLDKAKNLIMAFSRLRNAYEKSGEKETTHEDEASN